MKKIYLILCDTMPMMEELKKIANINNAKLLLQVGGCFTATTLMQILTGKMASDYLEDGLGYSSLEQWRNSKTRKITVPWEDEFVTSILSKQGWGIHLHNVTPDYFLSGDEYTDSYYGGYKNRVKLIKENTHFPNFSRSMMDSLVLNESHDANKWHLREINFIEKRYQGLSENMFYLIEYPHFHSYDAFARETESKKLNPEETSTYKLVKDRMLSMLEAWDMNEPESLFWIFSDHGPQRVSNVIPKADSYVSWVMIKNNIDKNQIASSNLISSTDFSSTILSGKGIYEKLDIDRIYFVEDGRKRFDEYKSTTAVACKVVSWSTKMMPLQILQVCYFTIEKKFYYHLNILNGEGAFLESIELRKQDTFKNQFSLLESALRRKFKWVPK